MFGTTDTNAESRASAGFAAGVVLLAACALLVGCGGSSHATTASSNAHDPTTTSAHFRTVFERSARAACEKAVTSAPRLASSAKTEIAGLCWRINYVVEDNEKTVRAICQEVANGSSITSESAKHQTFATCYAAGVEK